MSNIFRLQMIAALGISAVFCPVRPANAQPPCSGSGMTPTDFAHSKWWRTAQAPADFTQYTMNSGAGANATTSTHAFTSPGKILPIGSGTVLVNDNGNAI